MSDLVNIANDPVVALVLAVAVLSYVLRDVISAMLGTNRSLLDRVAKLEGQVSVLSQQILAKEAENVALKNEVNDCHAARGFPAKYPVIHVASS